MRKLSTILYLFVSCLVSIVALLFVVIEGRMLFAGDWLLYDSFLVGLLQVFFRFSLALFALLVGICAFVFKKKFSFVIECAGLVIASVVISFFASNGFEIYFLALSLVYFFTALFFHFMHFAKK